MCSPDIAPPPPSANRASSVGKSAAGSLVDPEKMNTAQEAAQTPEGTEGNSFINSIFGLQKKGGEKSQSNGAQAIAQFLIGG